MYELLEEGHPYELCRAGDYWSEEDVEFFKHNLDLEDSLLARHMKRSKGSIISRRRSEDPFVIFNYETAWLKRLHECEKRAYILDALYQAEQEEARLAEETRVLEQLEQLEYEITIPDYRNAVRRS